MSKSTLDIHQRLLDAAAAVQATVMPRLDAGGLEEAATAAIDIQTLVVVSQAVVAIGDAWDAAVDSCHEGLVGVMSTLSETAVAAARRRRCKRFPRSFESMGTRWPTLGNRCSRRWKHSMPRLFAAAT
jgi:hypothetical protein